MKIKLGFSTNCFPDKSTEQIIQLLYVAGCNTIDLRMGRNQKWEEYGIDPFINKGVTISFIGFDISLGHSKFNSTYIRKTLPIYNGYPIKVLASEECMSEENINKTLFQFEELRKVVPDSEILVETHHGFANIDTLIKLHKETDISILVDVMGLARLTNDPIVEIHRLKNIVTSIQVKGFDWENPNNSRHMPLNNSNNSQLKRVLDILHAENITNTIETRCSSFKGDVEILNEILVDNFNRRNNLEISNYK